MTIEVLPVGQRCNLACSYCYESNARSAGNLGPALDLSRILGELDQVDTTFTLFGGEPLLADLETLETLFAYGQRRFSETGVQTNGTLITGAHIELFKKYNVRVGFSVDGPGQLNRPRGETARALENLHWVIKEGIACSLIVTLHTYNASRDAVDELIRWLARLRVRGLGTVTLHLLEPHGDDIRLADDELIYALKRIYWATSNTELPCITLFDEIRKLLRGDTNVTCIWKDCDPYATDAVHGIHADGGITGCHRPDRFGIAFRKASRTGHERQYALFHTPQEFGGCKDCDLFLLCKGHCPGSGIDGDWRNRSVYCGVLKELFRLIELELEVRGETPLTRRDEREAREWAYLESICRQDTSRGTVQHRDHTDHSDCYRSYRA